MGPLDELARIDWTRLLRPLATAERALGRLEYLLTHEGVASRAWYQSALLREAAAQARLSGFLAKPDRIRLCDHDASPAQAGPADRMGLDYYQRLKFVAGLGSDTLLTPDALSSLRFHVSREVWIDTRSHDVSFLEDDPEDIRERLEAWLEDLDQLHALCVDPSGLPGGGSEDVDREQQGRAAAGDATLVPNPHADTPALPPAAAFALALRQWHRRAPLGERLDLVGRVTAGALAVRFSLLSRPRLFLSEAFVDRARSYRPDMEDCTAWIAACLEAIARQAAGAVIEMEQISGSWESYRQSAQPRRSSSRLPQAAEALFVQKILSVEGLRTELSLGQTSRISVAGALALMKELEARGLAREITGRRNFRLWAAGALDDSSAEAPAEEPREVALGAISRRSARPQQDVTEPPRPAQKQQPEIKEALLEEIDKSSAELDALLERSTRYLGR